MSEADERVCIYAVILTDTWDHLQKGSNDTEMRPCPESQKRNTVPSLRIVLLVSPESKHCVFPLTCGFAVSSLQTSVGSCAFSQTLYNFCREFNQESE